MPLSTGYTAIQRIWSGFFFFFFAEGLYSMVIGAFLQKQAGYLPSASSACGTYVTFPVLGLEVLLYHLST